MTPEEQARLNKLLQEGIELAKKLGDEAAEASFKNFNGDLKTAELAVSSLREEWKEFTSDIAGARLGFIRIVDEIKNMNSGVKLARSSFTSLGTIAGKLQSHQEGINTLSKKELETLKAKTADKVRDLDLAGKLAQDEVARLSLAARGRKLNAEERKRLSEARAAYLNINNEIKAGTGFVNQFNAQLDEQIRKQAQIEKALGVSGSLLKGLNKIPFIKDLPGMPEVLGKVENKIRDINSQREKDYEKQASELKKQGLSQDEINKKIGSAPIPVSKVEALKITLSETKNVVKEALTDPLTISTFLIDQFVDALKKADDSTGQLAKDFNLTYNQAANVRNELIQIGNFSGNAALNARTLQESMVAIGKSLGSNAKINEADLKTFTELREMAGYTNEELVGLQKLTLATGGNLKDNTKQFLGTVSALNAQNKLTINEKQLLKEVSNTSAAIKLSIGGTTEKLAEAAFKAKQFGINLEQADKMSESLLDFESSINNQITAELVTGKSLNLEKARLLALNGNIAEASAEVLKQVGSSAEFTKMNRIQQEALAKAVGMTREELANSLMEKEALNKLSAVEGKDAKEKFDNLVRQVGLEEAKKRIGNDQYANQLAQQSVQERLTQTVEKLKEVFISIAEPVMAIVSPIVNILTPVLSVISGILGGIMNTFGGILSYLSPIIMGVTAFLGVLKLITIVKQAIIAKELVLGSIMKSNIAIQAAAKAKDIGLAAVRIISGAWSALGPIPFVGAALAAAAAGVGIAYLMAQSKKGDDVVSEGGYGNRTLLTPKGSISLNNNDTVIAGTNLGGGGAKSSDTKINPSPETKTVAPSIDLSPLLAELQANKAELQAIKAELAKQTSKPVVVENSMNGTKFGTATAMGTYKTQ